jgi:hypothetical protein
MCSSCILVPIGCAVTLRWQIDHAIIAAASRTRRLESLFSLGRRDARENGAVCLNGLNFEVAENRRELCSPPPRIAF